MTVYKDVAVSFLALVSPTVTYDRQNLMYFISTSRTKCLKKLTQNFGFIIVGRTVDCGGNLLSTKASNIFICPLTHSGYQIFFFITSKSFVSNFVSKIVSYC